MNAQHSSATAEWQTPNLIVDPSRELLGHFDLDPATTKRSNRRMRAKKIYTVKDDGLKRVWRGKVIVNPPGGDLMSPWLVRPNKKGANRRQREGLRKPEWMIKRHRQVADSCGSRSSSVAWWTKLVKQFTKGNVEEAIFIAFSIEILQSSQSVNCGLARYTYCVPANRVPFLYPNGEPGEQPTHSNAIIYLGNNVSGFRRIFTPLGDVHNSNQARSPR